MTVGLVVEDRYPGAIEEMCRQMGINTKIRKHRRRINVRKASAYVKDLYNDGCEKVIILADGFRSFAEDCPLGVGSVKW